MAKKAWPSPLKIHIKLTILVASIRIIGRRVLSIHMYVDSDVRRDDVALMAKDERDVKSLLLPRDVLDGAVRLRPAIDVALRDK
jgi:hypothetical protein